MLESKLGFYIITGNVCTLYIA